MPSSPSRPHVLPVRAQAASEPVPPAGFLAAVASLDRADLHSEAIARQTPAPSRIAPWAAARSIELGEPATGRLVYLHDPAGQPAWSGNDRLVAFTRVEIDQDMAADPLLSDVVWDWLSEALAGHGAHAIALGGTVTTTVSRRYGSLAHVGASHEVELRCSWTPTVADPEPDAGPDLGAHLAALVATMAAMRGLPPEVPGVTALGNR